MQRWFGLGAGRAGDAPRPGLCTDCRDWFRQEKICGLGLGPRDHLISLCTVALLQWGQNFFSSSRSVVLRRFFWVV